jgi:hypothetical protein
VAFRRSLVHIGLPHVAWEYLLLKQEHADPALDL